MSVRKFSGICYDPSKREKTLQERGLDFADAALIFDSWTITVIDDRRDYGEIRHQTFGELHGRVVSIVWTSRGDERRIISMRHCHDEESRKFRSRLGRSR
ncbi:BrnT family toxin [Aureimonas altamirensis]|uniref:BrnT family toxin n=1 Tax=Aureimonas altamirensis TaxID=370622 RepID=UPI002036E712|nr:BrnT family toxin [Aureimonas altamirensis]MCM2504044.1 BrnT family toxin [Aureimonas altamirensis]